MSDVDILGFWFHSFCILFLPNMATGPLPDGSPTTTHHLDVVKSLLVLALFFLTLLFGLVPFALRRAAIQSEPIHRRRRYVTVFAFLSCFGGGVFLGTCMLDLLPDATKQVQAALNQTQFSRAEKINETVPLSELLISLGFLLVLSMEQFMMWLRERSYLDHEDAGAIIPHDHGNSSTEGRRNSLPTLRERERPGNKSVQIRVNNPSEQESGISSDRSSSSGSLDSGPPVPDPSDPHFNPSFHSTSRAVVLVLALSLHAVFEGMALGLESNVSSVLQLFGALAIHKSLLSFSMGLRLVQSRLKPLAIVLCCLVFSAMAPIGSFVGIEVIDNVSANVHNMVSGCLQSVACGTFLYVTAFEILPHELNESGNRMWKLLMLFLGFSTILGFIAIYSA